MVLQFYYYIIMAKSGRPLKVHKDLDLLFLSIDNHDNENVKDILQVHGIDAYDGYKRTALINAALYGNIDLIEWLIENKADINFQDRGGWTALHFATQEDRLDVVELLIKKGADSNIKNEYGNKPSFYAEKDNKPIIELLKSKRAK